jgi:hypothetical protein
MEIKFGEGKTEYGPGAAIEMTGDEVAVAIMTWLMAHDVHILGARTVTVNGQLCETARVYVDPSGFVVAKGELMSGRGPLTNGTRDHD